jgi:hypothetical protein
MRHAWIYLSSRSSSKFAIRAVSTCGMSLSGKIEEKDVIVFGFHVIALRLA